MRAEGLRLFATSSFQTNSLVLLHLLSRLAPSVPVWFLNTGYHFPETLDFRRQLARDLGLDIRDARSPVARVQQRDAAGRLLFTSDPDRCCHLNKVLPLDPVIATNDVWISGIRGAQSANRAQMGRHAKGRHGVRRFHPLIDWDGRMVHHYIEAHGLPRHPLDSAGYLSLGCSPCTRRLVDDPGIGGLDDRGGRWAGLKKTECGLHMDGGGT
jgi:phosphoadenosine phosphosulfate reductase